MKDKKSIAYSDYVNLDNCDLEPIQFLGKIQNHGYLLAFDQITEEIAFASENIEGLTKMKLEDVLGQIISEVIDKALISKIKLDFKKSWGDYSLNAEVNNINYECHCFETSNFIIVEFVESLKYEATSIYFHAGNKKFLDSIHRFKSLKDFMSHVCVEIRDLIDFDRVMIYKFDKDYNGEVIAESVDPQFESFLGLNYPHTDIPPQARKLYLSNLIRTIPDVNAESVAIIANKNSLTNKDLDLSMSHIRSVSPMHIEYLKNMGVGASLSISLIVDNKLWGLIACHHYQKILVPHHKKLAAMQFGVYVSNQIVPQMLMAENVSMTGINEQIDFISRTINQKSFRSSNFKDLPEIYSFMKAECVVILNNNNLRNYGMQLNPRLIYTLVDWLNEHIYDDNFYTNNFSAYSEDIIFQNIAGIAAFKLGNNFENCVIWFRPSKERIVTWAGNPEKEINKAEGSTRLLPRKSFEAWQEIIKGKSKNWENYEIEGARRLSQILQNFFLYRQLTKEQERIEVQNQYLIEKNAELERFNQICSHDLQEPTRKIRTFINILNEKKIDIGEFGETILNKIKESSIRLESLINGLLHLSRVTKSDVQLELVNLNKIVEDVKDDLELNILDKKAKISCQNLPSIGAVKLQMHQLFLNLISNALKYNHRIPEIDINVQLELSENLPYFSGEKTGKSYYKISVFDNGIGFDQKYSDRVFDVFQRLHSDEDYEGTGIGLSICKKIVENHNGHIQVQSEEGKGTKFEIFLPQL